MAEINPIFADDSEFQDAHRITKSINRKKFLQDNFCDAAVEHLVAAIQPEKLKEEMLAQITEGKQPVVSIFSCYESSFSREPGNKLDKRGRICDLYDAEANETLEDYATRNGWNTLLTTKRRSSKQRGSEISERISTILTHTDAITLLATRLGANFCCYLERRCVRKLKDIHVWWISVSTRWFPHGLNEVEKEIRQEALAAAQERADEEARHPQGEPAPLSYWSEPTQVRDSTERTQRHLAAKMDMYLPPFSAPNFDCLLSECSSIPERKGPIYGPDGCFRHDLPYCPECEWIRNGCPRQEECDYSSW